MKKIILLFTVLILLTSCAADNSQLPSLSDMNRKQEATKPMYKNIRQPAVAGQFYPGDVDRLKAKIKNYLKEAPDKQFTEQVMAVVAPHAGYDFSGQVAAYSYKLLEGRKINTVVIICNSHTTRFPGIAIDDNDAWETPLGAVEVDQELSGKLVAADKVISANSRVHAADHTLEVQLPFLQTILDGSFKIVPILFGNIDDDSYKKLAQALADNLGPDDIVVISTDMSHYPAYEDANKTDKQTLAMIKTADITQLKKHLKDVEQQNITNEQTALCGVDGVKTAMELYNLLDWDNIEILHYANSGDVLIGDKARVVGYGAMVFGQTAKKSFSAKAMAGKQEIDNDLGNILNQQQQEALLQIARQTVEAYVKTGQATELDINDERLAWKEGAFVTLHRDGQLRGCIGQIIPSDRPLWQVVRDMAVAACSEDHRFKPVRESELDKIDYEVSVLSVPKKIDDWQKIELGQHGVIVRQGFRSGVFLPQVATETGWSLDEFLAQLCAQKAGLPPDCYKDNKNVELQVFTAQVFSE